VAGDPTTAVIAGWVAAQNALQRAELANDPLDPAIGQTMGGEQFIHLVQYISGIRAAGNHFVGGAKLGPPIVIAYTPTMATVHSCIDDGLIVVNSSGQPVAGSDGQHTWTSVTSTMIPGKQPGTWIIVSGKATQTPWSSTTTCSA
jgi:hypothetical protein